MATHKNVKPKRTKDANKPNMDYKTVSSGWTVDPFIRRSRAWVKRSVWVGQWPCAEVEYPEGFFTHDLLLVNFQQLYRLIY